MKKTAIEKNWKLIFLKNAEAERTVFDPKTPSEAEAAGFVPLSVRIPSCLEKSLYENGLCGDPYFSENVWKLREYESCHQWYYTFFDSNAADADITFGCVDTVADIYVNGEKVGHTENEFLPYTFSLHNLKKRKNGLIVHIFPAPLEARKYPLSAWNYAAKYNYASLPLRKAAFSFGWDIFPRLPFGGIRKEVFLSSSAEEKFDEAYLYTVGCNKEQARLNFVYRFSSACDEIERYVVRLCGRCGESVFEKEESPWHTAGCFSVELSLPKLWQPRGYGEPYLYDTEATLEKDGVAVDRKRFCFGIRTLSLERTSRGGKDGKFEFRVNGEKVFAIGTNWVPVDAMTRNDLARIRRALDALWDLGCNFVRVWGGGIYECDGFYDWCDSHGILVWQDFMMGCAVYPDDERFKKLLGEEAEYQIKRLRNHPCLALWAGDNECDVACGWDGANREPFANTLTRELLPRCVRLHDFTRPYLPSSPYVDEESFGAELSEDHLWGPRNYFKEDYYKNASCLFASETGYHGCCAPQSLKTFLISPQRIFDSDGTPSREYLAHASSPEPSSDAPYAYRIGLMIKQAKTLFTGIPDTENDFIKASQISQAEALKYFIERFRIRRNTHGGILWWNLLDGWPQISDAVIDYYFRKKLAYRYIARSQSSLCLMCEEVGNTAELYAVNDTEKVQTVVYTAEDLYGEMPSVKGKKTLPARKSVRIGALEKPKNGKAFYFIRWQYDDGKSGCNHFHTDLIAVDYRRYLAAMEKVGFDEWEGF